MDGSSVKLNKSVVILTPGFPADESDSTCIPALQDYVECLHQQFPELNISVLAFQYAPKEGWYKWNGINVFSAAGKDSKYYSRMKTWLKILQELKSIYRVQKIDVLHSFWLNEAALIGQQFARGKGINHISTLFGQDALPSNRYLRLLNFRKTFIVANSNFTAKTFYDTTKYHANHVINFGLATEKLYPCPVDERVYDIVGVGSLIPLKNYGLFIEIVKQIQDSVPHLRVLLIGEGAERRKIENLILRFNLANSIELKGALPRKDVINHLRQSKIFLHTSNYESAGYVFLESLFCGCELVCFDTGFVPESSQSHVCLSKQEMIVRIKSLLNEKLTYEKVKVPTMKETVEKFAELYSAK
jgi:glycosyltransferase involved in cell wall biosynthesis